ncbi:MAG: alanine:cation symporter family protein, partial [Planctomycetes bacterium]|nr:alanine:cation symporter family protein [Planctomycetota bacterium]
MMSKIYGVPVWVTGLFLVVGVGMVIIGGIRRIGQVTSKIVPVMCLLYIGGALVTLFINASEIPGVFRDIFSEALTLKAGIGGFLGTMLIGVKRAAFSNEAGLGSAAIAHSTARTDEPVREGLVAMLGPFIDTIVVCTTTALVILVSGITGEQSEGVNLTVAAFNQGIPGFGSLVVASAVVLFAFSTAISWSYYGEKGIEYLFGSRMVMPYKVVF